MPDDGNGGQTSKLVRFWPWYYTIVIVLIVLYVVLVNPGDIFGDGKGVSLGWFQIYRGSPPPCSFWGLS